MSQNDFNIANQGFPATRADLNDALQALASNSAGDTEPSTIYAYQWWYDSTADTLKIRNSDNDAWIDVAIIDQVNDEWQITTGVVQATDSDGLAFKTDDGTTRVSIADDGDFSVDSDTLFVDATSNNVGIRTSSPADHLDIHAAQPNIRLTDTDDDGYSRIRHNTGSLIFEADQGDTTASSAIRFDVDNVEAMRISSDGDVLVGKTSTDLSTSGVQLREGNASAFTRAGTVVDINRTGSDGQLLRFRKDDVTVGVIGAAGGNAYIAGASSGIKFGNNSAFIPTNDSGAGADNQKDVGSSSTRFDDIYATNGNIQTSDQNEKQQIASLTTAEITAAKAISQLFKTFKWNDSVADKGDAARTHAGVIAQEVETAMTDAGLDAGDYAFFISNTWWETQTDVPAVAAVAEVLDDDGNVVTEAVEAKDAYTRTDTYDTLAEAPAGATERTRKGIRYPELLSFVGAATEQRLADIEIRLTALEV